MGKSIYTVFRLHLKMKVIALLLMSVIFIAGCTSVQSPASNESMEKVNGTMMENSSMQSTYSGAVLAGKNSPVIDFNPADYQSAIQTDKLIVLYFYANWCPICRAEVPQMYSAFEELNNPNVIAFRVNFNDNEADGSEIDLARQFGVPYQHTKVFLKNGQSVLKSSETWDKNRYLLEINKAMNMQ